VNRDFSAGALRTIRGAADTRPVRRLLVIAATCSAVLAAGGPAPASAAGSPRFAVWDLQRDLARASHTVYGDVKPWRKREALASRARGATLVRCSGACGFGDGWYAFSRPSALRAGDLVHGSARADRITGNVWAVTLRLTAGGASRWRALGTHAAQQLRRRGVPDVLVFAAKGVVVVAPFATAVRASGTTLRIVDLRRSDALRVAKALGGR
jgi:hypothetical protein